MGEECASSRNVWIGVSGVCRPNVDPYHDANGDGKRNPNCHRHLVPTHCHSNGLACAASHPHGG